MAVPISAALRTTRTIRSRKDDDDGDGLLKKLGRNTLSGAGYVGETIGKVSHGLWGSANFLTGGDSGGGGLLHLVPFSDAMGLTDSSKGIDLSGFLENQSVIPKNTPGFDAWDIPRFALDVAGDPLTYGTFGASALSKGAQALKHAGKLPKLSRVGRMTTTVGDVASKLKPGELTAAAKGLGFADEAAMLAKHAKDPLGGMLGVGMPFKAPSAVIGTGKTAQAIGGALDKVGEAARFSYPGRLGASLFSKANMGAMTKEGQQLAQRVTQRMGEADFAARTDVAEIVRGFHDAGVLKDQGALRSVVQALEGVAPLPQNLSGIAPQVEKMRKLVDDILPAEQSAHLKSGALQDVVGYMTRRVFQFADRPAGMPEWLSRKLFKTTHPSQISRKEFLRGIGGGTESINDLSVNPALSGIERRTGQKLTKEQIAANAATIKSQLGGGLTGEAAQLVSDAANGVPAFVTNNFRRILKENGFADDVIDSSTPSQLVDALKSKAGEGISDSQAEDMARWLGGLDPRHADEGVGVFATNSVENLLGRLEHGYRAIEASRGVREALTQWVRPASDLPFESPTLRAVVEKAGLTESAAEEIAQTLGANLDDLAVPADKAADILRVMRPFSSPENVNELLRNYDKVTNLYKSSLTTLFPAFHSRNFASGMIQNMLAGQFSMRSVGQALKVLKGNAVVKGLQDIPAFKGMTDAEATNALRDAAFAAGVVDPVQGLAATGDAYGTKLAGLMPGMEPTGIGHAFTSPRPVGTTFGQAANPLNMAGVGTAQDVFYPARVGREVGRTVESVNRLSPFIELLRKGYSPQEAAARVKATQVDYTALSDFERNVVKRVFPFASFTKGMASFVVDELMQRPGGRLGQTLRAQNEMRGEGPVPEYIAQGDAIPLGTKPDGTQSFISGLGLAHSDPLSILSARGGLPDASDMLSEGISRMNPMLKLPIEVASGESFFQRGPLGGRELTDMDPAAGRILTNLGLRDELPSGRARPLLSTNFENLLSNLPTSRLMTTARTLSDPRKYEGNLPGLSAAANTLTGVRVSDLSPGAADAMLRDELFAMGKERGAGSFETVRYSKTAIEQMEKTDPAQAEEMRQHNALVTELANRAKSRTASNR